MCTTVTTRTSRSAAHRFRNFDINSGQFGLNMIELVADKAPDATASRLGYHVALGFGQAMNIVNSTEPGQFVTESNFDQYLKEGYLEYLAPVGQRPADQRRQVRDSGRRGSDRDQGQLELLARTALCPGHSVLSFRRQRQVRVQFKVRR